MLLSYIVCIEKYDCMIFLVPFIQATVKRVEKKTKELLLPSTSKPFIRNCTFRTLLFAVIKTSVVLWIRTLIPSRKPEPDPELSTRRSWIQIDQMSRIKTLWSL